MLRNKCDTDHSYPMSHGLCRQVGLETRTNTSSIAMWARHLAPNSAQLRLLATGTTSDRRPLLSSVHVHASLACIEECVVTMAGTLDLER